MGFKERIKEIRKENFLTQKQFAECLSLRSEKIAEIENGRQKLTMEIALAIENKFNINMRWLLTGKGEKFLEGIMHEYRFKIDDQGTKLDKYKNYKIDLLENYPYEEKINILKQDCKKYNIQTTTIENKRLLYLIEKFDKDYNLEAQQKLEKIIKDLYLKLGKFYQYLDEKSKKEILENLEKEINKFEEENK